VVSDQIFWCRFTLGNDKVQPRDDAISPDGRLVAAVIHFYMRKPSFSICDSSQVVRLWVAQTGTFLDRYEGHLDSVTFSPDGLFLQNEKDVRQQSVSLFSPGICVHPRKNICIRTDCGLDTLLPQK